MAPRAELQVLLEGILGSDQVHFQPPTNVELQYPCILYVREGSNTEHADNLPYRITKRYQVTVIDRNPDSELFDAVESLPSCSFDRQLRADGLYHSVFTLFF